MKKSFRDFLFELEAAGELRRIKKPVDLRDVSALIAQSSQATLFEALKEYPGWQLASALVSTRKRLALAMGSSEDEIALRFGRHRRSLSASRMPRPTKIMFESQRCKRAQNGLRASSRPPTGTPVT